MYVSLAPAGHLPMSLLDSLLHHATGHVPRYRGLASKLAQFPLTTKRAIQSDLAAYLSDELGSEKSKLAATLIDGNLDCGKSQEYSYGTNFMVEESSGSSGIPIRTVKTRPERIAMSYGIWQYRRSYDPLCTPQNFYLMIHRPLNYPARAPANAASQEAVDLLYSKLSAEGFRWVHCGPGLLVSHASKISEPLAREKSVHFAESAGQLLRESARAVIEEKLRVKLIDQYGCRETWTIGHRCDLGPFEMLASNVVVELIDDSGNPILAPNQLGRVFVTSLHQKIFPIIRYETGDFAQWAEEGVGRRFRLIDYRQHNLLQCFGLVTNGSQFFRNIVANAFRISGFLQIDYLQVRQLSPQTFVLVVSPHPKVTQFHDAFLRICKGMPKIPADIRFDLKILTSQELAAEANNKPSLFTTKYLQAPAPPTTSPAPPEP